MALLKIRIVQMESLKEGYLLCVFGDNDIYYRMALRLINNLRLFDNNRTICILTDNSKRYTFPENILIKLFDFDLHRHNKINIDNSWHKFGLYPKVFQSLYTPFENTMYIDVDMVFKNDFTFVWDRYYQSNQLILVPGKSDSNNVSPSDWHWGNINNVIAKINTPLPQTFSTLIVYKKEFSHILKKQIEYIFDNLSNWNVLSIFRDGYPDEIIYSILLGINKLHIDQFAHDWIIDKNNCEAWNKDV